MKLHQIDAAAFRVEIMKPAISPRLLAQPILGWSRGKVRQSSMPLLLIELHGVWSKRQIVQTIRLDCIEHCHVQVHDENGGQQAS